MTKVSLTLAAKQAKNTLKLVLFSEDFTQSMAIWLVILSTIMLFFSYIQTNNTIGAVYVLDTGEKNYKNVGEVISENGNTELDYWNTEYANMINGTG